MRYLTLLLITVMAGCDPCSDVTCVNGTKEEDGSDCECVCDEFYSGDKCDEAYNQQFEGTYTGDQACITNEGEQTSSSSYTIKPSQTSAKRVRFETLGIEAEFTDKQGNIVIRKQNLPKSSADKSVEGDGKFGANGGLRLELDFKQSNGRVRNCTFNGNL